MIYKVFRKIIQSIEAINSEIRIVVLRMKYPGIEITGDSHISKGCKIICVDGGKLILNNVFINYGAFIFCSQNAVLKIEKSYIGMNSVIASYKKISIKENCEIAEMVVIRDQDHTHDLSNNPIKNQGLKSSSITLNENVWVGAKATILRGVSVGKNSVIGANALVNNSFLESSIIVGVPARKIN